MPADAPLYDTIGDYEVLDCLGTGGMGSVYKAVDKEGNLVAIKVLDPRLGEDEEFVTRFLREINTLAEISHPNIVGYIEADIDEDLFFYVMEFVEGISLADYGNDREFSEKDIINIGMQISSMLNYADKMHLIHRDIKPANIILEKGTGKVKVLDLGLARETTTALQKITKGHKAIGTVGYMAPEQARGEDVNITCDIYGLGATLYDLGCGDPPHIGEDDVEVIRMILEEKAQPLKDRAPRISEGLDYIICKMIAKEKADRYQKPSDILRDFSLLRNGEFIVPDVHPLAPKLSEGAKRVYRRNYMISMSLWGVIGVLGIVLLYLLGKLLFGL